MSATLWWISAKNDNFLKMFWVNQMFSAIIVTTAVFKYSLSATIFPGSSLYITENDGFVVHLIPDSDFGELANCTISFENVIYQLFPNTDPLITDRFETITGLSEKCGARVRFISLASIGIWTFNAIDVNDLENRASVQIGVEKIPDQVDVDLTGLPGDEITFQCPGNLDVIRYCEIFTPKMESILNNCFHTTKYPPVGETETFICKVMVWGKVTESSHRINLRSETDAKPKLITSEIITNANSLILSCKANSRIRHCRAELLRTGEKFLIMDGMQGSRYSSYETSTVNGVCQFEIPTPIQDDEKGMWRIHMELESRTTGCLLYLETDGVQEYNDFLQKIETDTEIETRNSSVSISCPFVPYELDYCYVKTPTNVIIYPESYELEYFQVYGRCVFVRLEPVTGQYICGFNSPNHTGDLFHAVNLKYYNDTYLEVRDQKLTVAKSTKFNMLCSTVMDFAVKRCLFISPSGGAYHLLSNEFKTDRYSYYGRGFEKGDCGIEINQLESDADFGEWICDVELNQPIPRQYSAKILISKSRKTNNN